MSLWRTGESGIREFTLGKEAFLEAAKVAADCPFYREDVEEEVASDETRSCYGCRFRRWSSTSFECLANAREREEVVHK